MLISLVSRSVVCAHGDITPHFAQARKACVSDKPLDCKLIGAMINSGLAVDDKECKLAQLEKGLNRLIRTVYELSDLLHGGAEAKDWAVVNGARAREASKFRLEGKEYVVQDGDVMHFRFNT